MLGEGVSYEERRVRVKMFGSLPITSPLLVTVPTSAGHPQQRLHKLAAEGFEAMATAVKNDLGIMLLAASGWRPHRWTSYAQYRTALIAKYRSALAGKLRRPVSDEEVFTYGRKFLAFDSPHETGLACDFGCGGLEPRSATIAKQKQTPIFNWLVGNASIYGWHPYLVEPWHWEFPVSLAAYKSGVAQDGRPNLPPCDDGDGLCIESPLDEND